MLLFVVVNIFRDCYLLSAISLGPSIELVNYVHILLVLYVECVCGPRLHTGLSGGGHTG